MKGRDNLGSRVSFIFLQTSIRHKKNNKKEQQDVEKDNKYRRVFLKK